MLDQRKGGGPSAAGICVFLFFWRGTVARESAESVLPVRLVVYAVLSLFLFLSLSLSPHFSHKRLPKDTRAMKKKRKEKLNVILLDNFVWRVIA